MKDILIGAALCIAATSAFADTYVQGHFRKDGTYVQPHVRSSPNSQRYDNYGSAPRSSSGYGSTYSYQSPYSRDSDRDGLSNQYDVDDDNDGTLDDFE